jgi:putative ABC transport system permease protein
MLTGIEIFLGLVASAILTRFMASLLFEVPALDPLTIILVPLTFFAIALVASYIPARKATLIEPMIALRRE